MGDKPHMGDKHTGDKPHTGDKHTSDKPHTGDKLHTGGNVCL
jgi:hypothetical protein